MGDRVKVLLHIDEVESHADILVCVIFLCIVQSASLYTWNAASSLFFGLEYVNGAVALAIAILHFIVLGASFVPVAVVRVPACAACLVCIQMISYARIATRLRAGEDEHPLYSLCVVAGLFGTLGIFRSTRCTSRVDSAEV